MLTKLQDIHYPLTSYPQASEKTLLLLLRIGTHLLAEGEIRYFQAGKGPDTDKKDEE
jgi:hypothetical protein